MYQSISKKAMQLISHRGESVALLAIVVIATVLRFYNLGEWSFWVDEVYTVQIASGLPYNFANDFFFAVREHPVTSGLIYTAVNLFPTSEFTARATLALVGIFTIPILFTTVKKQFDVPTALIFALLLAVSPWHLYWSQNARFYVTFLLFSWLSLFSFYIGFQERRPMPLALSLLFFTLAVSERLLGLFILPIVVTYMLYSIWQGRNLAIGKKYLLIFLLLGIFATGLFGLNFVQDPQLWLELYIVPQSLTPFGLLLRHAQSVDFHILLLALLGAVHLYQKKRDLFVFLLLAIGIPLGIVFVLSWVQFTHPRYTFASLIGWLVLAAVGLNQIVQSIQQSQQRWLQIAGIILLVLLIPLSEIKDYHELYNGGRDDWRSAFLFAEQHAAENDLLFTNDPVVGEHYLTQISPITMRETSEQSEQVTQCKLDQDAWFIVGGKGRVDYQFDQWVRRRATLLQFEPYRVRIYHLAAEACEP